MCSNLPTTWRMAISCLNKNKSRWLLIRIVTHSQNGFQMTKAADKNTIPRVSLKKPEVINLDKYVYNNYFY